MGLSSALTIPDMKPAPTISNVTSALHDFILIPLCMLNNIRQIQVRSTTHANLALLHKDQGVDTSDGVKGG